MWISVIVAFQFTFNKNRPLYIQWYPLEHRIVASWALLHLFLVSLVNTNCDVSVLKWNATLKHWSRQEGTIHNLWHGWACLSSSSSSYTHYALLIASSLSDGQRILRSNSLSNSLQGISIRPFPGLVNYVPAVAHLFCLNLPAAFSQPGNSLIEIPSTSIHGRTPSGIPDLSKYTIQFACRWVGRSIVFS